MYFEVTLLREAGTLQASIKHFQRDAPLPFGHLNSTVDDEPNSQL
jgi:hypothetical protein